MKNPTIKLVIYLWAAICCFLFAIPQAFADSAKDIETQKTEAKSEAEAETKAKAKAKDDFEGINFGVALSLTMDTGNHDRVESAEVVNGLVRVTKEKNDIPRVMLETHYFFLPERTLLGHKKGM